MLAFQRSHRVLKHWVSRLRLTSSYSDLHPVTLEDGLPLVSRSPTPALLFLPYKCKDRIAFAGDKLCLVDEVRAGVFVERSVMPCPYCARCFRVRVMEEWQRHASLCTDGSEIMSCPKLKDCGSARVGWIGISVITDGHAAHANERVSAVQ